MSDKDLRESARDASTGAPEAAARLLKERLRAGTLTQERMELAAYCGHEPARLVLDEPRVIHENGRRWFVELYRFGQDAWLCGAIACFELCQPLVDWHQEKTRAGIDALVTYWNDPAPDLHARIALNTATTLLTATEGSRGVPEPPLLHALSKVRGLITSSRPANPNGVALLSGDRAQPLVDELNAAGALAYLREADDAAVLVATARSMIAVIIALRAATGVGLAEAKRVIDKTSSTLLACYDDAHSVNPDTRSVVADAVTRWALA